MGCSPWGHDELDTTERLHFHFSLSCIGEGNGNPLQCSCLENPRDGRAWWAAIYGVAQSRTRLKQLSSSSRIHKMLKVGPREKENGQQSNSESNETKGDECRICLEDRNNVDCNWNEGLEVVRSRG